MKNISIVAFCLILVGVILLSPSPAQNTDHPTSCAPESGRYQILSLEFAPLTTAGSGGQEKWVFRIDTQTGKTWKYVNAFSMKDNSLTEGWVEIPERLTKQ